MARPLPTWEIQSLSGKYKPMQLSWKIVALSVKLHVLETFVANFADELVRCHDDSSAFRSVQNRKKKL